MIKKIIQFYQDELKFERILFNNSNWRLKLYSFSILIYLLLSICFGIAIIFQLWFLLIFTFPFIVDITRFLLFKKGYFAFVERKKYLALKTNLEKYIGHYDFDRATALFKFRKKKLKKFFKKMGWSEDYELVMEELEKKLNWEFKKFTFISVGVIAAIIASLKLASESLIKVKEFFAFLAEIMKSDTEKIPQELIPIFTITTILYISVPIILAFILASSIKLYIDYHFRIIWELKETFQELKIENKEILN